MKLIPVDFDPFASAESIPQPSVPAMPAPSKEPRLTAVDFNPFAAPSPASLKAPEVYEPPTDTNFIQETGKGLRAGVAGAKSMAMAAGTLWNSPANDLKALEALDRIDSGELDVKNPKAFSQYFIQAGMPQGLARRYAFSTPEQRAAIRDQIGQSVLSKKENRDWLVGKWNEYRQEAEKNAGRVVDFTDINSVRDFGHWLSYNAAQSVPYLGATTLAGLVGTAMGGPVGGASAVLATGYGMGVGDIQSELMSKGHFDQGNAALVGGVPYAAMEALGPAGRFVRNSLAQGLRKEVLDQVARSYFRRLGREIPRNVAEEFINEAGQEIIKDASVATVTGEPVVTNESLLRWFNAGMAGAAGGVTGAPVSAIPGGAKTEQRRSAPPVRERQEPYFEQPLAPQPAPAASAPAAAPAVASLPQVEPAASVTAPPTVEAPAMATPPDPVPAPDPVPSAPQAAPPVASQVPPDIAPVASKTDAALLQEPPFEPQASRVALKRLMSDPRSVEEIKAEEVKRKEEARAGLEFVLREEQLPPPFKPVGMVMMDGSEIAGRITDAQHTNNGVYVTFITDDGQKYVVQPGEVGFIEYAPRPKAEKKPEAKVYEWDERLTPASAPPAVQSVQVAPTVQVDAIPQEIDAPAPAALVPPEQANLADAKIDEGASPAAPTFVKNSPENRRVRVQAIKKTVQDLGFTPVFDKGLYSIFTSEGYSTGLTFSPKALPRVLDKEARFISNALSIIKQNPDIDPLEIIHSLATNRPLPQASNVRMALVEMPSGGVDLVPVSLTENGPVVRFADGQEKALERVKGVPPTFRITQEPKSPRIEKKIDSDTLNAKPQAQEVRNERDAKAKYPSSPELEREGQEALAGEPAPQIPNAEKRGAAGGRADRSGKSDARRDAKSDERLGLELERGLDRSEQTLHSDPGGGRPGLRGTDGGERILRGDQRNDPSPTDDGRGTGRRGRQNGSREGKKRGEEEIGLALSLPAQDFTISGPIAEGGQVQKFNDNIAAIRLLKELEAANRQATPEEQAILARYVGWGGLKQAFPNSLGNYPKGWEKRGEELRALLTEEEYANARRSILDSHYTSETVVKGIFEALRHLGFAQGSILEPSMGTGNFFGWMPRDMRGSSVLTGVELDAITGGIAKQLYPSANVMAPLGFQQARLSDNHFDLVVGNPPFGSQAVPGAKDKDISRFSIHNYFFARAVNKLRPGGVMAMVVTYRFLDKSGDRERAYIAHRAEFLGAIRLPNTAFQKNANTEVTTDIVFLRKLLPDQWGKADDGWLAVEKIDDPLEGDPIPVNRWFAQHPDMMLGRMERSGKMYREGEPTLASDGRDLATALSDAIKKLPQNAYLMPTTQQSTEEMVAASVEATPPDEGSYVVENGQLFVMSVGPDGRDVKEPITAETQWSEKQKLGETRLNRLIGMTIVRDAARHVLRLEANGAQDSQIERARDELNHVYDDFVQKYGFLNDRANASLFADDPDAPLVLALEDKYEQGISPQKARELGIKAQKSKAMKMPIFRQRVIERYKPVDKADNAKDALAISLSERGIVDLEHMAQLTGQTVDKMADELFYSAKEPLIFLNPATGAWETSAIYLSGNVKEKHRVAVAAGADKQAEALKAVFPADLAAGDVAVQIGAPWVEGRYYADFIRHLIGNDAEVSVIYLAASGQFSIKIEGGSQTALTSKWGISEFPADDLFVALMNNKEIVVRQKVNDEYIVKREETEAAQAKAEEIREEFSDWLMKDADRREAVMKHYNDNYNNSVEPVFDGSHLTLPGKSPSIKMRRHQRDAIWRGIQQRKVLFDHVVGAGKTFTVVATAMELKRMGLAKKPMVVVPNHLVIQWAESFYRLYPGARLLTMTKKDFEKKNRRRMLARIATGNYDAAIIAHSSFGFLDVSPERHQEFLRREIAGIEESIRLAEDKKSARNLERMKEKLLGKIKRLADKPKDDFLKWEELGVDQLFVDEAHEFKNLYFTTNRRGILGLGNPMGAKKAFDMYMKVRLIQEEQGGKGVIFATGTPVSNSLSELYGLQRFLGLEDLDAKNIKSFDAWAASFAAITNDYELDGTGVKYKQTTRLRSLVNVPEVMAVYRQFADSVTMDQIKQAYKEETGKDFPIPKIKGGKPRENVVVERSAAQAAFFNGLIARAEAIQQRRPQRENDNMLAITTDARKAALDMRLVDPREVDYEGSKVNEAARRIVDIWKKWKDDNGTQLVFLDLSIPKSAAKKAQGQIQKRLDEIDAVRKEIEYARYDDKKETLEEKLNDLQANLEKDFSVDDLAAATSGNGYSAYDDLRQKLIDLGVPDKEIAFIHDYDTDAKKDDLYKMVNSGKIRVLMGSTTKMGAGMNVQERLVALHHLDVPWRPSDIEQREGRIVRQGNLLQEKYGPGFEVEIIAYAVKQTYDARMWQTQEQKIRAIEALRNFKGERIIEEVAAAAASAAEMKAVASGNPLILEDVQLAESIKKLDAQAKAHRRAQYDLEDSIKRLEFRIPALKKSIEAMQVDLGKMDGARDFRPIFDGKAYETYEKAAEAIRKKLASGLKGEIGPFTFDIFAEFPDKVSAFKNHPTVTAIIKGARDYRIYESGTESRALTGTTRLVLMRLAKIVNDLPAMIESASKDLKQSERELEEAKAEAGKPWAKAEELETMRNRRKEVRMLLAEGDKKQEADSEKLQLPARDAVPPRLEQVATQALRAEMDRLGLKAVGLERPAKMRNDALGSYSPSRGVIAIALNAPRSMHALHHESIHAFRAIDALTTAEWKALETMADQKWIEQYRVREQYGAVYGQRADQEARFREEAIAEAFADYMADGYKPKGLVGRAFAIMRRLVNAVREALGREGIYRWEDIFDEMASGRVGQRQKTSAAPASSGVSYSLKKPPSNNAENLAMGQVAMEKVLKEKTDVEDAMYHPDVGWISFRWGDENVGIQHLIMARENKNNMDGEAFARLIPSIIVNGRIKGWYRMPNGDLRRNIVLHSAKAKGTVALKADFTAEKLTWVITAHPGTSDKAEIGEFVPKSQIDRILQKMIADAAKPGKVGRQGATQGNPSPSPTSFKTDSGPGRNRISDSLGSDDADTMPPQSEDYKDELFQLRQDIGENVARSAIDFMRIEGAGNGLAHDIGLFKRFAVHPRMIASLDRDFTPVYQSAIQQFERRDQIAAELTRLADPYFKLTNEGKATVNAVLELGRLEGKDFGAERTIRNLSIKEAALSKPGQVIELTQAESEAYQAVRTTMNKALRFFMDQTIRDFGFSTDDFRAVKSYAEFIDAHPDRRDEAKRLAQALFEIEQAARTGYVPFSRYGQVGIVVRRMDAGQGWVTDRFEKIEIDGLASRGQRLGRALAKRVPFLKERLASFDEKKLGGIPEIKERIDALRREYAEQGDMVEISVFNVGEGGPFENMVKLSDLDALAEIGSLDKETWEKVRGSFETAIQSQGFRKHFFGSRNTPGYSTDFERSVADYIIGLSGYLARRETMTEWDAGIGRIPDTKPRLREYAQKYREYVQNPQEELAMLRQAAFIYYLAGSPATAMVNMAQVPMVTAPYLSQFAGPVQVNNALARAYKDAAMMVTVKNGLDVFDPSKAPQDVRDAIQAAWDQGYFVPLQTHEVMGAAHNRNPMLRGMGRKAKLAADAVALMFSAAERTNRLVTFIAAYRMAKSGAVRDAAKMALAKNSLASEVLLKDFTPEKFAEWVIDETHFRMGKINRPVMMRGVGSAVFQFKGFILQMVELWWRLLAQNGAQGRLAFGLMLALVMMTSGFWGLPFAEDIRELLEAAYKRLTGRDFDAKTELREALVDLTGSPAVARAMAAGLPRAVGGIDVSARMGYGDILPDTLAEGLGVNADLLAGRMAQALEYAQRGQWSLMVAEGLPNFLKNPITAAYWAEYGVTSQSTGKVMIPAEELSGRDIAAKAIGFTPSKVAEEREANWAKARAGRAVTDLRSAYYGRLARTAAQAQKARAEGNADKAARADREFQAIFEEIQTFNEGKAMHERITIRPETLRARIKEELLGADAKRPPRQSRTRASEIDQVYGTE